MSSPIADIRTLINSTTFLTDGGLETTLIFDKKLELPHFAAFPLLEDPNRLQVVMDYYIPYLELAKKYKTGFILESATYKANPETGYQLGYTQEELNDVNQLAIAQLKVLKQRYKNDMGPILISGCMGPGKDGYSLESRMTIGEAQALHSHQVEAFKAAGADLVSAFTLNYAEEAIGITKAAKAAGINVAISFTLETDGRLIDGTSLRDVITEVDEATDAYPAYYMINCAHPTHFYAQVADDEVCNKRVKAVRANASCKSHAELDESTELDPGDRQELAARYGELRHGLPGINVWGGCCGTDSTHLAAICEELMHVAA
ncbi:MAG: homocysteine S-methyltransferase family protein [Bacteroidota bacterium]